MMIFLVTILGQFLIVEWGGSALQTIPLNATHWGICTFIGLMSLPVGVLIRIVPDELFFSSAPYPVKQPPPRFQDDNVDERLAWYAVPRRYDGMSEKA